MFFQPFRRDWQTDWPEGEFHVEPWLGLAELGLEPHASHSTSATCVVEQQMVTLTRCAWSVASQQVVQIDKVLVLSKEVLRSFSCSVGGVVGGRGAQRVGWGKELKNNIIIFITSDITNVKRTSPPRRSNELLFGMVADGAEAGASHAANGSEFPVGATCGAMELAHGSLEEEVNN
ncbi:hypothetical protein GCK72_025632 [Caenorhabditis remanei]|uniref:Uncharacterized protein n=1 Tax=Caenorhabditis remanei TaxID=31234 RepID=A0A6A5G368_CAERE|nr:hypothetical protein GCK72_025632 [Caenorhabditis remanei]KAF1749165.1 hypothetical protein GCK72_025632 [Caenorhabditis remanei]